MKTAANILAVLILSVAAAFGANGGTISGTVKDPAGVAFRGAFVSAQNSATRITTYVLSDKQGRYELPNLLPGEYEVRATAVGYQADPRPDIKVAAGQSETVDFDLENSTVRWSDLSGYQGRALLPPAKAKDVIVQNCFACHMFQTRMAAIRRDKDGWTQAVHFMLTAMHSRLGNHISDQGGAAISDYLDGVFGADSKLPRSPAALPGYRKTIRSFSDDAMKIEYVEYEMPGPGRMPFSAAPAKDGKVWIPEFGLTNSIGRLDPETGQIQEFKVPNQGTTSIHSAVPAADGSVWLAEQASNKIGRWDPQTRLITEYQDIYQPGMQGLEDGGSKHTVRIDPQGRVWATAVFSYLTVFDPETKRFSRFKDVYSPYGIEFDNNGNPWFAEFRDGGEIGTVDARTGKVTKWAPPTPNGWPRRIEIDSKGLVWFAEYRAGKIGRFDPQTKQFKEFELPGPSPTPYALGIDKDGSIWYSSDEMDTIGRLNPVTGQVTEYPYVHSENMMKEFFYDSQGRMWYGSAPNNRVGYFVPPAVN